MKPRKPRHCHTLPLHLVVLPGGYSCVLCHGKRSSDASIAEQKTGGLTHSAALEVYMVALVQDLYSWAIKLPLFI